MPSNPNKSSYVEIICRGCGRKFMERRCHARPRRHHPKGRLYCSRKCYGHTLALDSANQSKYTFTYKNGKNMLKHRWLMEQKLGRKLLRKEVVHHKNHDRSDNRLENLELMSATKHAKLHRKYNEHRRISRDQAL